MFEIISAYVMTKYGAAGGAAILTAAVLVWRRMPEKYKVLIKEAATTFGGLRKKKS